MGKKWEYLSNLETRSPVLNLDFRNTWRRDKMLHASCPLLNPFNQENAVLLGSPIGSRPCLDGTIKTKIDNLQILGGRIKLLQTHDAMCLLRSAFTLPRVLFLLCTTPCFQSHLLSEFNPLQRTLLETFCNIELDDLS